MYTQFKYFLLGCNTFNGVRMSNDVSYLFVLTIHGLSCHSVYIVKDTYIYRYMQMITLIAGMWLCPIESVFICHGGVATEFYSAV